MQVMSATEARDGFSAALDKAHREPVIIEKNGRPVAVLQSVEDYIRMKQAEERELEDLERQLDAMLAENQKRPYHRLTPELWEEMMKGSLKKLPKDDLSLPPLK